jgi:peptidoglycan-associated lipoprotein
MKSFKFAVLLVLVFVVGLVACKQKEAAPQPVVQAEPAQVEVVTVEEVAINVENNFGTVLFDYKKAKLSKIAKTILDKNAQFLIENPDVNVSVEGYCDDRGGKKYNLRLGQKRANAVKRYYVRKGVSVERIQTVSLGNTNFSYTGKTKEARSLNRRVETKIATGN